MEPQLVLSLQFHGAKIAGGIQGALKSSRYGSSYCSCIGLLSCYNTQNLGSLGKSGAFFRLDKDKKYMDYRALGSILGAP